MGIENSFGNKAGEKSVIANNGKYFGVIPLEYDECIYVGKDLLKEYLVKKNGKYGLISYNSLYDEFYFDIPIEYKSIQFNENEPFYTEKIKGDNNDEKVGFFTFAIVQDKAGYRLYNIRAIGNKLSKELYQSISFARIEARGVLARARLDPHLFIAQKNDKYGLLSQNGTELTDFVYDSIGPICNGKLIGIIDGKEIELKLKSLIPKDRGCIDKNRNNEDEKMADPYKDLDMDEEVWDAMTDGQYGPYPGGDIDYDIFGF